MILAAVATADDASATPPRELTHAFRMRGWNIKPYPGAFNEWPAGELNRILASWAYYDAWRAWTNRQIDGKISDWLAQHKEQWPLIQDIIKLRSELENNGA